MVKLWQKRLPVIILTLCLTLAAVFAENFVFAHLDHDCIGDHCSVCLTIKIAQNLLEGLGRIGIIVFVTGIFSCILIKSSLFFYIFSTNLVLLKVKFLF